MSNSHNHFFFPSSKPRTRNARRYGLLGCGGCLGLAVLIFTLIGVLTTLGFGGGSSASLELHDADGVTNRHSGAC